MKKLFSFILILSLLTAFCACNQTGVEPTDPTDAAPEASVLQDDETVTDASAVQNDADATEIAGTEQASTVAKPENSERYAIPDMAQLALEPDKAENKKNFTFTGEKEVVQAVCKMLVLTEDGLAQYAVDFAGDGSNLTISTLEPDGTDYHTVVEFDEQGKMIAIVNGSGNHSEYIYSENTCELRAYDADDALIDRRIYYYPNEEYRNANRVERMDENGTVLETYEHTYNEDGLELSRRVENASGYVLYNFTYNQDNKLERIRIEQNNKFYAFQIYTYDENGKRDTYLYRNDEFEDHPFDMTILYNNVYAADGTYMGCTQYDSVTDEIYISAAYEYTTTEYPHYAAFIAQHYATY